MSLSLANAVSAMTGTRPPPQAPRARSSFRNSYPSMSGIRISESTTSGWTLLMVSSACRADSHVIILAPDCFRMISSNKRASALSSTATMDTPTNRLSATVPSVAPEKGVDSVRLEAPLLLKAIAPVVRISVNLFGVRHTLDIPSISEKTSRHILRESQTGVSLDGDVVVIIDPTQIRQPQVVPKGFGTFISYSFIGIYVFEVLKTSKGLRILSRHELSCDFCRLNSPVKIYSSLPPSLAAPRYRNKQPPSLHLQAGC
jgi:hypothetical protein